MQRYTYSYVVLVVESTSPVGSQGKIDAGDVHTGLSVRTAGRDAPFAQKREIKTQVSSYRSRRLCTFMGARAEGGANQTANHLKYFQ